MKVAMVVQHFPRMTSTFILAEITGLIDRGHEVDIYSLRKPQETDVQPDVAKYRLLDRTRFIPDLGDEDWGRYDILHFQFGHVGAMGLRLVALGFLRGRKVTTFHGPEVMPSIRNRGPGHYRPVYESSDLILTVSERLRRLLVELGCDPKKIAVHRLGVDRRKFQAAGEPPPGDRPTRIVSVGRLTAMKGIEFGVRAVARLARAGVNVRYDIVGEGEEREVLARLIGELGMEGTIRLAGLRSTPEVADFLRGSHVLLAPSVTTPTGEEEGIPTVVKEAMASRLPVVSTLHAGIPEIVEDGATGFVVPEKDVDALADRLHRLVADPSLRASMGEAGHRHVSEHYDMERQNDRLVAHYRSLL